MSDLSQPNLARAVELARAGQLDRAEALCLEHLAGHPNAATYHLLGTIQLQSRKLNQAIAALRQAANLAPQVAVLHSDLGAALAASGQVEQAVAEFGQAIQLDPAAVSPRHNLALALFEAGQHARAIGPLRDVLRLAPESMEMRYRLAVSLVSVDALDEAIAHSRHIIAARPEFTPAYDGLAAVLGRLGRYEEALHTVNRAIQNQPDAAPLHARRGEILLVTGHIDEAVASFGEAIALDEQCASAHMNLGMALLARGEMAEGWREYEWRLRVPEARSLLRNFAQPRWSGQDLRGRTILLHAEQGFGDVIQFVRFVPEIASRGARVIVEAQRPLLELLGTVEGITAAVAQGDSLPAFDFHLPLLSVAGALNTTLETIPARVPYLSPPPARLEAWQETVRSDGTLRVGLCYAGGAVHPSNRVRCCPTDALAALGVLRGVRFYDLTVAQAGRPRLSLPSSLPVIDLTARLRDFADTAALVANLDLVISVDTAVAHLAGAMGKETWILLPHTPEWRWQLGDRSPWYPTMRLFLQPSPGDWAAMVKQVCSQLAARVGGG